MNSQNDFILVNKPKGWTSFDVVKYYKNKLKVKKIGHGGTLDPLADGLLILAINENTKKLSEISGSDKEYEFEILFGLKSETGDMEGRTLDEAESVEVDKEDIVSCINKLTGIIKLIVPKYSAVKIKGDKLYNLARKGKIANDMQLPIRKSQIYSLQLQKLYKINEKQIAKIKVECSSGTYVRSLVEKIGELLKIPTVAYSIKRTKVGNFDLKDAEKLI
ncbi:MAG: tRNA pseudouridine synthase B [Berkelbacteria bacterium GW2011_GWA2_35_9]|uniref:tRNA pseudouridine synthase B n=1 Tax=Berkelbacteria bacterium GW2011_GWA2_35_9 TaxID=1618333 RepID=A0A0G0D3J1_9BACT|nr:MAG: tRNA pseudouridine synthase B [Berkelbacteria bacterium GW2011_GWA2_35_9]